jgi:type VI secretion system protein ImpL
MRDLGQKLAPLLAGLAERRIAANGAQPTALYDDLKSYLILGGRSEFGGPAQSQHLVGWAQTAWAADAGSSDAELQAGSVARHSKAMMEGSFRPLAIDENQVEFARAILREQNPALRVYGVSRAAPWPPASRPGLRATMPVRSPLCSSI